MSGQEASNSDNLNSSFSMAGHASTSTGSIANFVGAMSPKGIKLFSDYLSGGMDNLDGYFQNNSESISGLYPKDIGMMKLSVTEIQDMIGKQAGPTNYSIRMYSESGPSILYLNNEQF